MAAIAQSDVTEKAAFDPEYQLRASDGSGSDGTLVSTRLRHMDLSSTEGRASTPSASIGFNRIISPSPSIQREETLHPDSRNGTPRGSSAGRRRRSTCHIRHAIHSVVKEEPPQGSFHDAAFQAALLNSTAQLRDLQYVLGSSTLHTDSELTIYSLYNRAAQLSDYRRPTTRKVALVGDAGVGKSILINSLLDVQNLA
ncbi:hypothetical protein E6O75_ATG03479 [Venturia nashicola]|uniref:Uncharacterized protein n=1 Tax=Venturia nashicola TaxID=86259 RepID=A0A4Z1PJ23_9PEZI|nr:hypothetical protein E6O75_ATG03479 [Venturia nashicola]